jgi:phosphoribosyl-AMP cyclohydrolase
VLKHTQSKRWRAVRGLRWARSVWTAADLSPLFRRDDAGDQPDRVMPNLAQENSRQFQLCVLAALCSNHQRMSFYDKLKFDSNGLIPAIIQEQKSGRVVMMAWMNRASLEDTIKTGKTHFWSRSRQKYWMKGEESGNTQTVKGIAFDCDGDTLLIQVEQKGPACHEGYNSCFFRSIEGQGETFTVTEPQLLTPEQMYKKK